MKNSSQNFIIDSLGFICFILLVSTGVVMYYLLPAGSGHSLAIWGLGRHDWGAIHFWVAVAFLGVMAFHLLWHWRWILNYILGKRKEAFNRRALLSTVAVLALVGIGFAPVFSPVEQTGEMTEHREGRSADIRGSMSLNEVYRQSGVPVEHLIRELALPETVDRNQPLRELKDAYNFDMDRVRAAMGSFQ